MAICNLPIQIHLEELIIREEIDIICCVDRLRYSVYFVCNYSYHESETIERQYGTYVPGRPLRSSELSSISSTLQGCMPIQHQKA